MLSKREKLLIQPWQERRYIDHRRKVNSALPAIDVEPPATRGHVLYKSKKLQKESERCAQITEDNFILIRHLSDIMRTHRVDNYWIQEPPTFLHKVGIYQQPQESVVHKSKAILFEPRLQSRKEKCYACGPLRFLKKEVIPEERIPWDPDQQKVEFRKSLALSEKSKQLEVVRGDIDLPEFRGQTWSPVSHDNKRKKNKGKTKVQKHQKLPVSKVDFDTCSSHCIELTQGPLNLSVTFPTKTTVVYKVGKNKRILHTDQCQCTAFHQKPK
ncbi:unnamed protein product [Bemisia tabaci]|uniref:Uncharacterized protein n=1 Tax=Bemisia tabaci TaxID=7038 RepID=A0A9P0ADN5_BEMTA|nr:unnamed protein product [Bemisia tabaci]